MPQPSEPWLVFFQAWDQATHHFPRISPIPDDGEDAASVHAAMETARQRVRDYMQHELHWPADDATRIAALFSVELIIWARLDGFDRSRLKPRLQRAQAKVRAAAALGVTQWRELVEPREEYVAGVRVVRLPSAFYAPRMTDTGEEVRDVPPWPGATAYVTDGARFGIRLETGDVQWFEDASSRLVESLQADFEGVDVTRVVEGLKEYVARRDPLPLDLANDVALLEAVACTHRDIHAEDLAGSISASADEGVDQSS